MEGQRKKKYISVPVDKISYSLYALTFARKNQECRVMTGALLSNAVTWCFVLIFPARRMLMMFTSAWRINYWLLSASLSCPARLNTQVTHCRAELRMFLLLLCDA